MILFALSACQTAATGQEEMGTRTIAGKFSPANGKTLFILGQDNDTINAYMTANPEPVPSGVTSYTSLQFMEGLDKAADNGAGTLHLDELAKTFPDSALVIGLYLVDFLDDINEGRADAKIDDFLAMLAAYDRPVFLRFGYEFDGMWNHYEPEAYKKAWITFYERMQAQEVTNVAMVWQSATYCDGTYMAQPIEAWYPGSAYVDWVALSFFTQTSCDLSPIHELLDFAREQNKPVMIAESAPQRYQIGALNYSMLGYQFEERTAEQIWAEWYRPFFDLIHEQSDLIQAVAYINTYWDEQPMWGKPYRNGYWGDSRVQANVVIQGYWLSELENPLWQTATPTLFTELSLSTKE